MDYEDLDVEDVTKNSVKKKVKSGAKGKSAERDIVHALNERFAKIITEHPNAGAFSRSLGSGNRFGQKVVLSASAKEIYAGDITCPNSCDCSFNFVIESKKGYNDIDLFTAFVGKCKGLDAFLSQVDTDSKRVHKRALLIWKKDRKPALAFFKANHGEMAKIAKYNFMQYLDWTAISLENILTLPDDFWFKTQTLCR